MTNATTNTTEKFNPQYAALPAVRNIEVTRSSSCYGGSSYRIFDADTNETIYMVKKTASWQDRPSMLIGNDNKTIDIADFGFAFSTQEVIDGVCGTSEVVQNGMYYGGRYAGCRKFKQLNSNYNQEERLTVKGMVKLATYLAQFATKTWADHQAEKEVADNQGRHDRKVSNLKRKIRQTQQELETLQAEYTSLNG